MESRDINDYIMLGWNWRALQDLSPSDPVHGEDGASTFIEWTRDYLEAFKLHVTMRAGKELWEMAAKLSDRATDAKLTPYEANRITELVDDLSQTFDAELEGRVAYEVTEKRFDVRKLLSDVSSLFAPAAFKSLPSMAVYDFQEAGKAIAFEMPTAAAFHLMRATEEVFRSYYCRTVKRNRVNPLLWGPMTQSLRKRSAPPPATLLGNLDHIRENFRNPTQHPEAIYDIHEAQSLFGLCVDVVERMQKL